MSDLLYYGSLAFLVMLLVASIVSAHRFLREHRRRQAVAALQGFLRHSMGPLSGALRDLATSARYFSAALSDLRDTPAFQALMMDAEANRYATRTLPVPDLSQQETDGS